jgi:hypothetical protein
MTPDIIVYAFLFCPVPPPPQRTSPLKMQCTIIYNNSPFAYEVKSMQNEDEAGGKEDKGG